jgi:hypothetical protein
LHREVRYRLLEEPRHDGFGTALNASSTGIAFECDRPLPVDARIELSVNWPVPFAGASPLQLELKGRVVRCEGTRVACAIERFEFRAPYRNVRCLRAAWTFVSIVHPRPRVCPA